MVGDSRTDLDTARARRRAFVGVTFGYTPVPMATLGPDLLIDSFDELTPEQAGCSSPRALCAAARRCSPAAVP